MAILIAPDKFKGTLTARETADIIASELTAWPCVIAPMADGGEGTAQALCSGPEWEFRGRYYLNPAKSIAVIDSSAVVGIQPGADILTLTSEPLGALVRHLVEIDSIEKVIIGVGGTGICDGGIGFLHALGDYKCYADRLLGLCDVAVPLLPQQPGGPSTLMFAPQKGATETDIPVLRERLEAAMLTYGNGSKPFDGAGGGLGFAIGNAIGAPCVGGAQFVLDHFGIDWREITCVVTGEGRLDEQTAQGKVVSVLACAAAERGVPCFVLAGSVSDNIANDRVINASVFLPNSPLTPAIAAARISHAARQLAMKI